MSIFTSLGKRPTHLEKQDYALRAINYYKNKFHNEHSTKLMTCTKDPYKDRATKGPSKPNCVIPITKPTLLTEPQAEDVTVTWFGHSTILIQMHQSTLLIDPIFSNRCSPFSIGGTKRYSQIPMSIEELPQIDLCLYTHDHYDHLDYQTVRQLDPKITKYLVPLGIENHLKHFGVCQSKIKNMAWWEETEERGLTIACTPAQHFSGRMLIDMNQTLWCSWVIKDAFHKIYDTGDSGFSDHIQKIHEKYGDMDLVLSDGAQYSTQWHDVHMFPEEAIEGAKIMNAKYYMPIHWGTFVLSDHAWNAPAERQKRRSAELQISFITPMIGQTIHLGRSNDITNDWWNI